MGTCERRCTCGSQSGRVSGCILGHIVGSKWNSCVRMTLDWGAQSCNLVEWCRISGATIIYAGVSVHLSACL